MTRCLVFLCALPFASLTISSNSYAAPPDPGVRVVRYDDLDLSTVAGMKVLHRRIEAALDQVCLDPYGPSPAGTINSACKQAGRRDAFAQIGNAIAQQQAKRAMTQQAAALPTR